jgi:outer membrane protein assembly factor BamB
MKTKKIKFKVAKILVIVTAITFITGCEKANDPDNDPDNTTKTPVWIYDTGEDPYQSKPCVAGDKVIVCTMPDDNDDNTKAGTHCINLNTGARVWKVNDSLTEMVTSPLVYNNLILEGGLNPHARRLSDGVVEWKYVDDLLPVQIYSSPLIAGDAAYFACMLHFVRLNAGTGAEIWQTDGLYNNLRLSSPVFKNDRVYYADASYYNVTSFLSANGQVEWASPFSGAFTNKPVVMETEFFVGIQDASADAKTLRCMYLSDRTEKWGVKLGSIVSDLLITNGKVYAIGLQTIHCRSVADGAAIWSYDLVSGAVSEPLVTGDKLFVGYGKGLICLNAETGDLIWDYKAVNGNTNAGFSTPTLNDDKIYVSCSDGNVYCFNVN